MVSIWYDKPICTENSELIKPDLRNFRILSRLWKIKMSLNMRGKEWQVLIKMRVWSFMLPISYNLSIVSVGADACKTFFYCVQSQNEKRCRFFSSVKNAEVPLFYKWILNTVPLLNPTRKKFTNIYLRFRRD